MKLLDMWIDEPMPLVHCDAHIFEPKLTFGDNHYRCALCGRLAVDDPQSDMEFARDVDRANPPRRAWCHARHICHHWFEDECSDACDRGEHVDGHNHPGCSDRSTPDSRTSGHADSPIP